MGKIHVGLQGTLAWGGLPSTEVAQCSAKPSKETEATTNFSLQGPSKETGAALDLSLQCVRQLAQAVLVTDQDV